MDKSQRRVVMDKLSSSDLTSDNFCISTPISKLEM